MTLPAARRSGAHVVFLDRSLEELPLFRLSDTAEETAISYSTADGGRWRVLAPPGDRLPGTFDQDVYIELMRRYGEAGEPADGVITFTLHALLRSIGRQADGRTYEQLRGSLYRLQRTVLQSEGGYFSAASSAPVDSRFSVVSSVSIERRRAAERDQLLLFSALATGEPGEARVVISPAIRENIGARHIVRLNMARYFSLPSAVARRLYRLLEVARASGAVAWRVSLERLRVQLPLAQHYPSHLQRVLQPAHEMLQAAGVIREAVIRQQQREWFVDYLLGRKR